VTPSAKTDQVAVEDWFDPEAQALIGTRCRRCATVSFPKERLWCQNPRCGSDQLDEVRLSRRGRIWSYTDARYQPPAPYVPADPYEPFCLAAVELEEEKLVVMGQVVAGVGVDDLEVGQEMELVIDTLYEDDDHRYLVWKWQPMRGGGRR
jgi:uncharacterized OB-fold protein